MTSAVLTELRKERNRLLGYLQTIEKHRSEAFEGSVRIVKKTESTVAYYYRKKGCRDSGTYISKENSKMIRSLIQKKYDNMAIRVIQPHLETLNSFLKKYNIDELPQLFYKLDSVSRKLISLYEYPRDEYVRNWKSDNYMGNPHSTEELCFVTENNEKVRSKSEVIIANMLKNAGIPYRYEYPLAIGDKTLYPDFTLLDVANKREILWEHCGKMSSDSYRSSLLWKLDMYATVGITTGNGLILTFEDFQRPLNLNTVKNIIYNLQNV